MKKFIALLALHRNQKEPYVAPIVKHKETQKEQD